MLFRSQTACCAFGIFRECCLCQICFQVRLSFRVSCPYALLCQDVILFGTGYFFGLHFTVGRLSLSAALSSCTCFSDYLSFRTTFSGCLRGGQSHTYCPFYRYKGKQNISIFPINSRKILLYSKVSENITFPLHCQPTYFRFELLVFTHYIVGT